MRVVCFGQQNWDYCWTGKQHLMVGLARRGHQVLYVDPAPVERPAGANRWLAAAPSLTGAGVRRLPSGVVIYTHVHAPLIGYRANQWRQRRTLASLVQGMRFADGVALTLRPRAARLVDAALARAPVHYAVDESTAFPNLTDHERQELADLESQLVREADVVLGISPRLVARWSVRHPRTYLQPSGAAVERFAPSRLAHVAGHPALAALPRPRIGFVGQVDERLDQPLLAAIARAHREWQIVLVGRVKPGVDVSALERVDNIHLIGYLPYEALPSAMRELDVGLVPYHLTELTHCCSPLKVYEYLAAGLPVVSRPLDGLGDARAAVALAEDACGFGAAIASGLASGEADRERRLAVAAASSWDVRVDALESRLAEALSLASPAPRPRTVPPYAPDERPSPKARAIFLATRAVGRPFWLARVAARAATGRRPLLVRRVLVARQCRLGDLVAFQPALAAIRRQFPHAHLVFGVQPGAPMPLIEACSSSFDELRVMQPIDALPLWRRVGAVGKLMAEGFDVVIQGAGFMLMRDAFFTGAPRLVGLDDGHPLQRWNTRRIPYDPARHETENNMALAEAIGQRCRDAASIPSVDIRPEALTAEWHEMVDRLRPPAGAEVVVIHGGAQKPSRRWPADRFAALATRILAADPAVFIVLTGTSDEAALARSIADAVPPPLRARTAVAAGRTGFTALHALLAHCRLVISNDTGVMHLARALGAPLVALLGPENPRRWSPHPWGRAPAVALRYEVPCAPCLRWECAELYCLRRLPVEEVFEAVRQLLAEPREAQDRYSALRLVEQSCHWEDLAAAGLDVPRGIRTPVAAKDPLMYQLVLHRGTSLRGSDI